MRPARRRSLANQLALSGTQRSFSASHPFWEEALLLRREYNSYAEISARAKSLGYELSLVQIRLGLQYAEARELLPGIGGTYLRRRYAEAMEAFSAVDTLRYVIGDVIAELERVDDHLSTTSLDEEEFIALSQRRDEMRQLIWTWTREYAELQDHAVMLTVEQQRLNAEQQQRQASLPSWLDRLTEDFHTRLAPPPIEAVVTDYGADNLRIPLAEHVDGSAYEPAPRQPIDYATADEEDIYQVQAIATDVIDDAESE